MDIRPTFQRQLPEGLEGLYDLALDLRWTGSQMTDRIWKMLDPEAWEITNNPYMILENVSRKRLEEVARDEVFKAELESVLERKKVFLEEACWFDKNCQHPSLEKVAYFSMEFGLSEALPIYSGGLGILAGDYLKTASDLGVPVVGVGLLYQQGYFRQTLNSDGSQIEAFPYNDPTSLPVAPVKKEDGSWLRTRVELPGRDLILRVWRAKVGRVDLYLLDSNDPLNRPWDRGISANLYPAGQVRRLVQAMALGIGGWNALEEMGIDAEISHLNEGDSAFVILARACSFMEKAGVPFSTALLATRPGNVFTTHTPVGFDEFDFYLVKQYLQRYVESFGATFEEIMEAFRIREGEPVVTAYLAMRGCGYANGVSRLHGSVSREIFQHLYERWPRWEVPVDHVTNGVHIPSWDSPEARNLWEKAIGKYHLSAPAGTPWDALSEIGDADLWRFRREARKSMIEYVRRRFVRQAKEHNAPQEVVKRASEVLNPEVLTIGFARRFAEYKRPTLLIQDPDRLKSILLDEDRPVQLIVAGKAHPGDAQGRYFVRMMAEFASRPDLFGRVVFLEDYDIALARRLEPGVDLWINVPRRPMEACGTSGMKVLVNGGLNVSELDGWWAEAYSPEVGWSLGDGEVHDDPGWDAHEADQLYSLLEREIAPSFYERDEDGIPRSWIKKVRASMSELTPRFSCHRMMREYAEKAYLPGAKAYRRREANGAKLASELEEWRRRLDEGWKDLRFGELKVERAGESWRFEVQVYFGRIAPEDVKVELYLDPLKDEAPTRSEMIRRETISEPGDGYIYTAEVSASRPAGDYTPRVIPSNPEAIVPAEEFHILWQK
jgi:starch phosphorylase